TYWYDASKGFLLAVPSHRLLTPDADALRALVRRAGCAGVRFAAPLDAPGKLSYQIVCDDRAYGLERLSANTRSKVRRGLRRCEVMPVAFSRIADEGRAADVDTVVRQSRGSRHADERWARYWQSAAATPSMEGWAAFADGKMAAFLVTVRFGDCVEFLLARSRTDCLDAYPNNALIYTVAHEMLARRGMRQITFGLESLEPVGPLDQFKFGMGFRTAPLRQRIVFHPLARVLLERGPVRALVHRWAAGRGGRDPFWRKADGLLRFAEQSGLGEVG
ncbi:MAG: GNAT family N-acetyltransferase, partial [Gemmatimonadaceae bacterium]